jgi:RNA polymerase sigma factor (sigma-70 family)
VAIGKDGVIGQVRLLFNVGAIRELTDGQLLERFATARGESAELAFAALVERHGPMVMRVCRGVLDDPHEAEDAFQATFLVLVRRARGLWVRDSLGPWLHQVALRTASCARSAAARRRRHERRAEAPTTTDGRDEPGDDPELGRVLHEEIDRLPERYRAPVVLCDLQGRTHEQAARHLGWPIGTVKSRQSRGRERLRERLRRRGVAPEAGLLAALPRPSPTEPPIPAALVESTTEAAVQFLAARALVRGSAASLARGVLRAMSLTRWLKVASVALVLGGTASGVAALGRQGGPGAEPGPQENPRAARGEDAAVAEVKRGKFVVSWTDRGVVEASRASSVISQVEGQTTIVSILPEGTKVKTGDVVCELDSAGLRDQLTNQQIAVREAGAAFQNAVHAREAAEIAVKEYLEGNAGLELVSLRGAIAEAKSAIAKAEARLERTRRARKRLDDVAATKGTLSTPAEIMAGLDLEDRIDDAELAVLREGKAVELAEDKLRTFEKYTKARTTKELRIEVTRKQSEEFAKQAAFELARSKAEKLRKQIESCTIRSPDDGAIVYANDTGRANANRLFIEEGASVRERQIILHVVDLNGPMRVNAKVREAIVDKVVPGQRVRIRVNAFPGEVLSGVVETVAPLPDPSSFFRNDTKVYTTMIRLEKGVPGLRPGMVAEVEIVLADRDDVLTIPVQAVLQYGGKDHVAVKTPGGGFEWRDVTLGMSNFDTLVEVKQGLQRGDLVASNPLDLMTEEEKRQKLSEPGKTPARRALPR